MGTPLALLGQRIPHEALHNIARPSADEWTDGFNYRAPFAENTTSAAGGSRPMGHDMELERGQALPGRRQRAGSLSSTDADGVPDIHAIPGWPASSLMYVHSPVEQPYVVSPQRQAGGRQHVEHQQPTQQLQQHVVEQWMRKTEAHIEGLERLMQRLMFILEAVEARELGLN